MPGGKVHTALTAGIITGVLAPYAIVQWNGNPWLYVVGCATGLLVTPDLDIDHGNISDTIIRRVFPPAQWIWRILWTPYALLIPHRHPISHMPIMGTILRIGYAFLILNLLNLLWFVLWKSFDTVSFVWIWNWSFFFGLVHVDSIHWLADNTIKGKETFEGE